VSGTIRIPASADVNVLTYGYSNNVFNMR